MPLKFFVPTNFDFLTLLFVLNVIKTDLPPLNVFTPPPNLMKSGYGHPRSKKSLEKCTTSKKQNNCDICRLQNYFFDENFRSKKNVVLMGVLHDCEGHRKWEAHVAGTTHLSFWPLWLIVPLSPVTNLISSPCVPCAETYRPCK